MTERLTPAPFDPDQDWPPVGAFVTLNGHEFRFEESDAPGWWNKDRTRYARPFEPTGQLLAKLWLADGRRMA